MFLRVHINFQDQKLIFFTFFQIISFFFLLLFIYLSTLHSLHFISSCFHIYIIHFYLFHFSILIVNYSNIRSVDLNFLISILIFYVLVPQLINNYAYLFHESLQLYAFLNKMAYFIKNLCLKDLFYIHVHLFHPFIFPLIINL